MPLAPDHPNGDTTMIITVQDPDSESKRPVTVEQIGREGRVSRHRINVANGITWELRCYPWDSDAEAMLFAIVELRARRYISMGLYDALIAGVKLSANIR